MVIPFYHVTCMTIFQNHNLRLHSFTFFPDGKPFFEVRGTNLIKYTYHSMVVWYKRCICSALSDREA